MNNSRRLAINAGKNIPEDQNQSRLISEARLRTLKNKFMERVAGSHIKPIPSLSPDELHVLDSGHFDEIELMLFDKKITYSLMSETFSSLYDKEIEVYSVHLPNFALNRPSGKQVSPFLEFTKDVSEIFNPEILVIHCLYERVSDFIANLEKLAGKLPYGKRLVVENLPKPGANIRDLASLRDFFSGFDDTNGNIGFCLDTTHIPVHENGNATNEALKFIDAVPERLFHIHASDKRPDPEKLAPGGWIQHLPLGDGVIDWRMIKIALLNAHYSGRIVLEYQPGLKENFQEGMAFWNSISI